MYDNPWTFEGKVFETEDINGFFGFVYVITSLIDGKKYIGRKYFYSFRKKKGSKRRQKSESDWKEYYGSSDELKEEITWDKICEQIGKPRFNGELRGSYFSYVREHLIGDRGKRL